MSGTFQAPSQALGPHVAALAIRFYRGSMFPAQYNGTAFIANHGSWNRANDIGSAPLAPLLSACLPMLCCYVMYAGWKKMGRSPVCPKYGIRNLCIICNSCI